MNGKRLLPVERDVPEEPSPRIQAKSRLMPVVLAVLFLASMGLAFLRSPYFRVERIEVCGIQSLSAHDIEAACGLARDENIFDADLEALAARVRINPRVDRVSVKRRLPSTIVVTVAERVPVAMLPYAGYYVLVDDDALAIGMEETYAECELPLVTGLGLRQVLLGKRVEAPDLESVLLVARLLPEWIRRDISEINSDEALGISLCMQSGARMVLGRGRPEEFSSRLAVLEAILSRLKEQGRHATYIDVRFEKRPVVKDRK